MKQLIVSIYLVTIIVCGLTFNYQSPIFNHNQNDIANSITSEGLIYSANIPDFSKLATNKEINPSLIQLPHLNSKYTLGNIVIEKYFELANSNKISHYIQLAKFYIIRLEGHDIIHPFNYFW